MCVCWAGEFVFRWTSVGHQPGQWLTPFGPSFLRVCPSEQPLFTSLYYHLCRFYPSKSYNLFHPFFKLLKYIYLAVETENKTVHLD